MVSRRITGGSWNIRNYIPDLTIHELSSLKKKQADPFMDQLAISCRTTHICVCYWDNGKKDLILVTTRTSCLIFCKTTKTNDIDPSYNYPPSLSKPWFLLSKPLISYRYTTSSLFSPASFSNSQSLRAFLIYYLH
ncbi:hypothetical protein RCL_jg3265.t1 [Rhizophagus clarus]|uniref:Uncharacterized protein n=1 Tax=Rhizophagus clarus TaxID=94130 RepID=A0A8H3M9I5_9GLOM|nr:hypothetical protein RCL_jg3265.t1 [Rhizophagus clarus]